VSCFHGDAALQKLASVERSSEPPLTLAIVATAQQRKLPLGRSRTSTRQ
jgi:hypothetical protein